jgi:hypothetical protein
MDLFGFSKLSTMIALSYWSAFPFYFKERSVGVFASGRAMAFNTSFTASKYKKTIAFSEWLPTKRI